MKDKIEYEELRQEEIVESKRIGRGVFIIVAVLFIFIILITEGISMLAGKTWGTVALAVMAAIIAGGLYRKEIKAWFLKRRG